MKKSIDHILYSVLLLFPLLLNGQNSFEKLIIGTWEHQEPKQDAALLLKSKDDKESNDVAKSTYLFQKEGVLDIKEEYGQFKENYSISDSTLRIGLRTYRILQYSTNQFTIEEKGDFILFKKKLEFTRADKSIEPISFKEEIMEYYKNGNPKTSGFKENGFENGIWTEWYENGRVKSVTYFSMGSPLMTTMFNKQGLLISKSWFDRNSNSIRTE